jgi:putative toxin-antitoxin system antitoxin component (TIGR02293 family)
MVHATTIAEFLGGKKELHCAVRNDFDLLALADQGLPSGTFRVLVKQSGFAQEEIIHSLGLSRTTILRRLKGPRLGTDESEKTIRFARVFSDILELFDGDEHKAREWLKRPNRGLAGKVPLDLLHTDLGARQVELSIGQMRAGVFG